MSTDPINRLPGAFGKLLTRLRLEQHMTPEAFAVATGLHDANTVTEMERGEREPTLTEFFRIANALRSPPAILFIDVIAQWRADPTDYGLYKSRASDVVRLCRLG
jgi:transcriptional regulator with XRE-family HTH domain